MRQRHLVSLLALTFATACGSDDKAGKAQDESVSEITVYTFVNLRCSCLKSTRP
jgi:hypothetical protein